MISTEKVPIPSFFFEDPRGINWNRNSIKKLKCEFEVVEIRPPTVAATTENLILEVSKPAPPVHPQRIGGAAENGSVGRRSNYPKAKKVLALLYQEDERFREMSAAQLLQSFSSLYRETQFPPGVRSVDISERALRNYIKRYRQESAKIGKN